MFLKVSVLALRPSLSKAGSAVVAGVGVVLTFVTSGAWVLPFHLGVGAANLQRWGNHCSAIL